MGLVYILAVCAVLVICWAVMRIRQVIEDYYSSKGEKGAPPVREDWRPAPEGLKPAGGDDPPYYVYHERGERRAAYRGGVMYQEIQEAMRRR